MSYEYLMKQIYILTEMMGEERPEVEKHILNKKIVELYEAKIMNEFQTRLTASSQAESFHMPDDLEVAE